MHPSLRIVPGAPSKAASIASTANSLGLHDTLNHGPRSLAVEAQSHGDIRNRLENWEATQDNLRLSLERNAFGMHAPMRRLMERKIVSNTPFTINTPQSNLHLDILMGRDETIDPEDVFLGRESAVTFDTRVEMEKKIRN